MIHDTSQGEPFPTPWLGSWKQVLFALLLLLTGKPPCVLREAELRSSSAKLIRHIFGALCASYSPLAIRALSGGVIRQWVGIGTLGTLGTCHQDNLTKLCQPNDTIYADGPHFQETESVEPEERKGGQLRSPNLYRPDPSLWRVKQSPKLRASQQLVQDITDNVVPTDQLSPSPFPSSFFFCFFCVFSLSLSSASLSC